MFTHIKEKHPDAQSVQGGSWLYNRVEYTRLFPDEYARNARPAINGLVGRGTWGQFLRHGEILNEQTAERFRERVSQWNDVEQYRSCFPYWPLIPKAPIQEFYNFYHL